MSRGSLTDEVTPRGAARSCTAAQISLLRHERRNGRRWGHPSGATPAMMTAATLALYRASAQSCAPALVVPVSRRDHPRSRMRLGPSLRANTNAPIWLVKLALMCLARLDDAGD